LTRNGYTYDGRKIHHVSRNEFLRAASRLLVAALGDAKQFAGEAVIRDVVASKFASEEAENQYSTGDMAEPA
jgi:hypothetical protein